MLMELSESQKRKIKWTTIMAFASLGILLFAILVNEFREPLLGVKKGYAPHNSGFNILFFIPSLLTALGLSAAVIARTIKHRKNWTDLRRKATLTGLSIPAIVFWIYLIFRNYI